MTLYIMNLLFIFCACFTSIAIAIQSRSEDDFYYAAVVEYSPVVGSDGNDTLNKNSIEYVRLIGEAAKSADLVVFPELGLNYVDDTIFVEIPFGNNTVAPVDNSSLHPVLRKLSKAARDYQVYVSLTIHEKDHSPTNEILRYNTNIVFDRKGVIVARYRKYNLFNEPLINITNVPEVIFFDSDFGVRFGMFICFDIFFKYPALQLVYEKNITDIIFPSWWFSELPSLLSIQMQYAWAYMTDSNLLSAGINSIQRGSTGSGIYEGKNGPVVYVFSESNQTQILFAKLYKKGKTGTSEGHTLEIPNALDSGMELLLWNEDLHFYETHLLTHIPNNCSDNDKNRNLVLTQILNKTICQSTLCCKFMINMTFTYQPQTLLNMSDVSYKKYDSFYHYQYRLAVFNGVRLFHGGNLAGIQVCAVLPCLNGSLASCGQKSGNTAPLKIDSASHGKIFLHSTSFNSIAITAVSKEPTDFTFPDILESSNSQDQKAFGSLPNTTKINFKTNYETSNLQFASDKLVYAGIYSRIISRDGKKPGISSANRLSYSFIYIYVTIYVFIYFLSKRCKI